VRVLLDANLPRALAPLLTGHEAHTAQQRGWADLDDGPLLDACAAAGYEAFVTLDQNLRFQQNLRARPTVAVLVLRARSNRIDDLRPLVPPLLAALPGAPRGDVTLVAV
jgi:hypothetical protein